MGMDARRARLQQLAAEWSVHTLPPVAPPMSAPQFRTPSDDFHAEELLKRRRMSATQDKQQSQGTIKRAFSSHKKTWEPTEIFEALNAYVANGGAPGVADALIAKLLAVGGNVNVPGAKSRTNLLTRRRSLESMERSRILQKAIENRQIDMVAVLAHHADPFTLDAALAPAIRSGDLVIVNLLLSRGANASQTQDAQDAFRQMCIVGGYSEVVALVLQSEGRPPPSWLSMAMVDAARKGCLQTVLWLSRFSADGEYNRGEAIKTAIAQCRVDIVLGILTGSKPPALGGQGVLESFSQLHEHATIGPNEKMALTEALLCAGAAGDATSIALDRACAASFYDMVGLLVSYGTSIEYQDASVLRQAILTGQSSLVQLLLSEPSTLSPIHASQCIGAIPKTIPPEGRHAMLNMLLRRGAAGLPLHEALVDAVRVADIQSVELLVAPNFPGAQPAAGMARRHSSPGIMNLRHETASVDHKQGLALCTAAKMGSLPMVKQLLAGKPSSQTLDQAFPFVLALQGATRYQMAECLLASGVSLFSISAALQRAIEEQPPRRDESLIGILLRYNADVNFNDGAGVLSAITSRDVPLLGTLLRSKPSPQTMASAMARVMTLEDKPVRYEMVRLLIGAGAGHHGTEVSEAIAQLLPTQPVDVQLATLLLEQGRADANFDQGLPVAIGTSLFPFPILTHQLTTPSRQRPRPSHPRAPPPARPPHPLHPLPRNGHPLQHAHHANQNNQNRLPPPPHPRQGTPQRSPLQRSPNPPHHRRLTPPPNRPLRPPRRRRRPQRPQGRSPLLRRQGRGPAHRRPLLHLHHHPAIPSRRPPAKPQHPGRNGPPRLHAQAPRRGRAGQGGEPRAGVCCLGAPRRSPSDCAFGGACGGRGGRGVTSCGAGGKCRGCEVDTGEEWDGEWWGWGWV